MCTTTGILEIRLLRYRYNEAVRGQHGDLRGPVVFGSASIPFEGEYNEGGKNYNYPFSETESRISVRRTRSKSPRKAKADIKSDSYSVEGLAVGRKRNDS